MECILEVEEDCFSTSKTQGKNELIPPQAYHKTSSQQRQLPLIQKPDISISDFSKIQENSFSNFKKNIVLEFERKPDFHHKNEFKKLNDTEKESLSISFSKSKYKGHANEKTARLPINTSQKKEGSAKEITFPGIGKSKNVEKNIKFFKLNPGSFSVLDFKIPSKSSSSFDLKNADARSKSNSKSNGKANSPNLIDNGNKSEKPNRFFKSFKDILQKQSHGTGGKGSARGIVTADNSVEKKPSFGKEFYTLKDDFSSYYSQTAVSYDSSKKSGGFTRNRN